MKALHALEKAENSDSARVRDMILRNWSGQGDPAVVAALSLAKPRFGRRYETACFAIILSSSIVAPSATALPGRPEQSSADGAFVTGIMNKRWHVDSASQAANKRL
jgi:hypothetical protein